MFLKEKLSVRIPKTFISQIKELAETKQIESVSAFVEMCVEYGLKFTLHMSRKGIWHLRGVRVGGFTKSAFDIIQKHLDNPYKVGVEIGRQANEFGKFAVGIDPSKKQNWEKALDELSTLSGWGDFSLKEGFVTVVSPYPSPQFIGGVLDGFLAVKSKKVSDEPLKFQIS